MDKLSTFIELMNSYGASGEPFLFIIDFDIKRPEIHKLSELPEGIKVFTPWYTGVFGVFDVQTPDSAVMIKFIEKDTDRYIYKSGGGITFLSDPEKEY